MRLSKYEQETVILWNREEAEASIYTHDSSLKKRLRDYAKKYPECCRLESKNEWGGVTYILLKDRLSVRLLPPYRDDLREAARTRAEKHQFKHNSEPVAHADEG